MVPGTLMRLGSRPCAVRMSCVHVVPRPVRRSVGLELSLSLADGDTLRTRRRDGLKHGVGLRGRYGRNLVGYICIYSVY